MRKMKRSISMVLLLMTLLLAGSLLPASAYTDNDENAASDVEITPKISLKGPKGNGGGRISTQAATGVLGDLPPDGAQRWAVVIGISDYYGTSNDIQYADEDAIDMLNALIMVYGYRRENIRLLISDYIVSNATRGKIIEAIDWLREMEHPGDEVLFFYSGHGARGRANDGDKEAVDEAVVPYECTSESLIWDGDLKSMFSDFETTRIIFIFDSCYAGGMTDLKATGRIIVVACSESGLSYEDSTWENGQFTYYFVDKGVLQGLADEYDNVGGVPDVTIEEAFDYAKANCAYQKPVISDSFTNDMLL